ncbi:MAG TPA: efflux RND transporter periplasmic adaptor subunit [Anseongella sp.]
MKKNIIQLLNFFGIFLILAACGEKKQKTEQVADLKEAFVLKKQEVGKTLKIPAELLPYERAEIHAKVEAFVQKVRVDIGDKVRSGQVLAILDAPEAAARYAEANAEYQAARARYTSSLDKFRRIQIAAKEEGAVAEGELISVKNQMLADSAAILSASSTAQAYKQIQNYLTIRAPFSGTITSRSVDPGDLVGMGSVSGALFTLETSNKFRLRVHVPETYVNSVPSDQPLSFTTDAIVNETFEAKLTRKSGNINPDTRTELWEYEYENTSGKLKPGMYTTAQLQLNRPAASFVVPNTAVVTSLEKKFVVRMKGGKTEWVDVRQGVSLDEGMEIFGELAEGDTLLVRGSDEIRPETALTIQIKQP